MIPSAMRSLAWFALLFLLCANVAAADAAGDTDKAITAYRSYLRSNPAKDQRALAESNLRELEEKRASAPAASGSTTLGTKEL